MRTVIASKKPAWIVLAVVLVFHTLLLSVQTNKRFDTRFVQVWILNSLGPLEKIVDFGVGGVQNIWNGYIGLVGVNKENRKLQYEIDQLRLELGKKGEESLEVERLHRMLDLQGTDIGKTVVARIIGRSPSLAGQALTIDKGTNSNIQRDATVITHEGVVGRVITSVPSYAVVQLIIDSQSAVGFIVRSSRRLGILKGTGGAELEMELIDDDNDIKQGDELITSGQDQIYPKGLPLGVVVFVGQRQGNFKVVRVRPSVNFGHLEEVLCMTDHLPEVPVGQVP